jgi:hypothetical protein
MSVTIPEVPRMAMLSALRLSASHDHALIQYLSAQDRENCSRGTLIGTETSTMPAHESISRPGTTGETVLFPLAFSFGCLD